MLPDHLQPTEMRVWDPDLEDVFIALLRQREQAEGKAVSSATTVKPMRPS